MSTRAALQAWSVPPWAMVLDSVGHVEDVVVDSAVRGKGIDRETVPIESGCYKVILYDRDTRFGGPVEGVSGIGGMERGHGGIGARGPSA